MTQKIDVSFVLDILGKIASATPVDVLRVLADHADRRPLAEKLDGLPPETKAAIKNISFSKDGPRIEMHDKAGAVAHIARVLGLFSDTVNWNTISKPPIPQITDDMTAQEAAELYKRTLDGGRLQ